MLYTCERGPHCVARTVCDRFCTPAAQRTRLLHLRPRLSQVRASTLFCRVAHLPSVSLGAVVELARLGAVVDLARLHAVVEFALPGSVVGLRVFLPSSSLRVLVPSLSLRVLVPSSGLRRRPVQGLRIPSQLFYSVC
jgi:hypothetical protein